MQGGYMSSILSSNAWKDIFNRSASFPRVIFIGVQHICNKFQGILIINLLMSKFVTIIVCLLVGQLAFALHLEAEASATAAAAKVSTPDTQNTANAQPGKSKLTEEAKEENAEAIAGRDFEVQPIPVVATKASGSEGKKNKFEGEKEKEEEKKEQKEEEKEQEKEKKQEKEEEKKEHKLKEAEKQEEKSEEQEQAEEEQGHYPHSKQEERLLELQKKLQKEKEKYQLLKSFLKFQAEQQIRQKLHKFQAEQESKHHKDHQNHKILRQEEEQDGNEEKKEQEEAEKKQKKDEHYQKQGVQIQKKLENGIQSGVETGVKDVLYLINAPHGTQKAHGTAKTANHLSQE